MLPLSLNNLKQGKINNMNGINMEITSKYRDAYKKASGGKWYLEKFFRISYLERRNCYREMYELNKEIITNEE